MFFSSVYKSETENHETIKPLEKYMTNIYIYTHSNCTNITGTTDSTKIALKEKKSDK